MRLARRRLTTGTVGFGLAPRINAAGPARAGDDGRGDADHRRRRARRDRSRWCSIDATSGARRSSARSSTKRSRCSRPTAAWATDGRSCWHAKGWHAGVIGIVAGRLAESYHRPADRHLARRRVRQGSARSIPGFDLYEAIKECSDGLIAFGGHAAAAGLKLDRRTVCRFRRAASRSVAGSGIAAEHLERVLAIDAEVPLGVLSLAVVEEIEKLEPHGIANPRPLLAGERGRDRRAAPRGRRAEEPPSAPAQAG